MGCHTWTYAHIPEKAKNWNREYIKALKDEAKENKTYWESLDYAYLKKYADDENKQNKEWIKRCHKAEKSTSEKFNKFVNTYFSSIDEYKKYVKKIEIKVTPELLKERQIKYLDDAIKEIQKYGEDHIVDFISDNLNNDDICTSLEDFGLFLVKDGKIYRETTHEDINDKPIFKKRFHDMFRISDYDAKPCYNLEETIKRCEEYGVDCPESVYEFWKTYPDGIIEFG
ncbi:MAG: hypothetical protein [Wendovervirus sonii]|uniref:Uncharacterized protein n=1 Tax=phage Lak_Megaphage_Sonny TaxID=3109229 RepID=A0ABZ0Z3N5_9CAUD|nr:MAG: hypothetical protein [phage Lak_Megaphage_Sonny]